MNSKKRILLAPNYSEIWTDIQSMRDKKHQNYYRIAKAIEFIKDNFRKQPTLEELAEVANLSPYHFQRVFTEWAGTSPKKFLQYVSIQHARKKLAQKETLFDTAYETGLSGTSRLHDMFVKIVGMTPAEFKNGGRNLKINWRIGRLQME